MHRRGMSVLALAGVLALLFTGSAAAAEETRGTASTDLLGIELDVDAGTLGSVVASLTNQALLPSSIDVLDVGTYASTDVTDRTEHSTPLASGGVVPLRVGSDEIGAVKAETSDGTESGTSGGAVYGAVTDVTSAIGASIAPLSVRASASKEKASASVDTLAAEVAALLQTVDLDVEVSQLSSLVDQVSAASGVSVEITSLDVSLGDLLPVEVLRQLPLSVILDLLEALDVAGLVDVQAQIDALQAAIADLEGGLSAVEQAGADLQSAAAAFQAAIDLLNGLATDVSNLQTTISGLSVSVPPTQGELDAIIAVITQLNTIAAALGSTPASCSALPDPTTLDLSTLAGLTTILTDLSDCADDLAVAIADEIAATLTIAAGSGDGIADEVTALTDAVAALEGLLDAVAAAAGDLEAVLSTVLDILLGEAAGTQLLSVGDVTIGVSATSTGDVDTSSAVAGCTPVTATVLGASYTTPSCSEGLSAVQDVAAAVNGAVSTVESIFATLPLADLAAVGDFELELFGTLTESVVEDGDYVVATAQIEVLELVIPALTLDPDAAGLAGGLGDLELPDVLGIVGPILDDAVTTVEELFGTDVLGDAFDTALAAAQALLADGSGAVDAALDAAAQALADLLASLDGVGTLVSFTTPSVSLTIDPSSTAEYAAAAAAAPPPDSGGEDPLPTTGGGLAVLGLATLGGALLLLRGRRLTNR